jgi:hypothetical protein
MKKQVHVRLKNMQNLVMGPKGLPDTKTYWPTDHRPQIQLQSNTRPLVREGAVHEQASTCQTKEQSLVMVPKGLPDTKT